MKTTPRFQRSQISLWLLSAAIAALMVAASDQSFAKPPAQTAGPIGHFAPVATYQVSGEVAEIVAATPNGQVLVYTDSESQEVGFVDISDPANPTELGTISIDGEPTAVAITPDGRWALVVVHGDP